MVSHGWTIGGVGVVTLIMLILAWRAVGESYVLFFLEAAVLQILC